MKTYSPQSQISGLPNQLRQHSLAPVGNGATGNSAASDKITADQVRTAVRSFWEIWKAKSAEALADAYSTNSITFRAGSVSVEPGFMGIAQRSRYRHRHLQLLLPRPKPGHGRRPRYPPGRSGALW